MSIKNWWIPIAFVIFTGLAGVFFMGIRTYQDAPPMPDFISGNGDTIIDKDSIIAGQVAFQRYALMDYGSMYGDGAGRGPDFTADALHRIYLSMKEFYRQGVHAQTQADESAVIEARVRAELKQNKFDPVSGKVVLTDSQAYAYHKLVEEYGGFFDGKSGLERMLPARYITSAADLKNLSSFFFWGAWVCAAQRPGTAYSYTHNWPYDPEAGNLPTAQTVVWSVIGCLGFMVGLGGVLYWRGRMDKAFDGTNGTQTLTVESVRRFSPSKLQRSTYKFFAVAAALFLLQIVSGVLTIHDFVQFTHFFGIDLAEVMPITVTRSWHLQLSLLWITCCWIGASIFVLPMIAGSEPKGQTALANILFATLVVMTAGNLVGVFLGPKGMLDHQWWLLGHQGWEFVELGKLWQVMLFVALGLWALILFRGLRSTLFGMHPIALPNWLFYSVLCVLVLFCSSFVATPETNFVIADFWRWCVIHMWVEAFFEVFTTALIAYFMYLMGLVSFNSATRVVYLATLLFLGSGILGISHNFYWNAKPVETLAIGSVFSTLQVVPLILLTLDAWRLRSMPGKRRDGAGSFAQDDAFLFLLGVNFWNFLGAGVFGFIINLPIVNYYEHGTYLTVNHGHAALMGVYGNLAIAALLFCARYVVKPDCWDSRILTCAFWSMNIGLALMVLLDLFPAGILQFQAVLERGLWFARSQEFVLSTPFQTLTWMRAVGGAIFVVGGVVPLFWFVVSRQFLLKAPALVVEPAEMPVAGPEAPESWQPGARALPPPDTSATAVPGRKAEMSDKQNPLPESLHLLE